MAGRRGLMQYGLIGEHLGHSYSVLIHRLITGEDYELMTPEERDRLTIAQLNQIDSSLIYELGRADEMTEQETGSLEQTESDKK